ncbi:AAA family ATPase [Mucilaginibacter paludis]|uniref:Metal dependent phosphohydrolase n=1 Tax=Mucilaginibacter paludis DSM 18603 TaxID=714943 RepID=H1YCS6_9SPHI|nr:AAA family ATPase [Mucilaginibacter paludis]EHQ24263.1 metal dependent phosphohydrolase [Mucilaginibacter paludis DSM 18603]
MWTFSENKEWRYLEHTFDWVKQMNDVQQDTCYHAEGNVAIHTRMVLAALQQDAAFAQLTAQQREILWTAALLHDVEKRSTTVFEPDGSITSNGHARKGAQFARQLLYNQHPAPFAIREQIAGLVRYHGLPIWLFEKPNPVKALAKASMEVNTQWLALLARADMLGRHCADQDEMLYRIDCFEALCREHNCWGNARTFKSAAAQMYYMQHDDAYLDYVPFEQPAPKVILMSGLPGAGKDTLIKKQYPGWPLISLDDMRMEHGILPTDKTGNGQVIQLAKEQARAYLRKQQGFVWNATNTTSQMRMQLIDLFTTYRAEVSIIYVEIPYRELLIQNKNREANVPVTVLDKLIHKLEVPAPWEAHHVSYCLTH